MLKDNANSHSKEVFTPSNRARHTNSERPGYTQTKTADASYRLQRDWQLYPLYGSWQQTKPEPIPAIRVVAADRARAWSVETRASSPQVYYSVWPAVMGLAGQSTSVSGLSARVSRSAGAARRT